MTDVNPSNINRNNSFERTEQTNQKQRSLEWIKIKRSNYVLYAGNTLDSKIKIVKGKKKYILQAIAIESWSSYTNIRQNRPQTKKSLIRNRDVL